MAKIRQDAWTHEDDLLLAETVLRHIREGSTQLNAFDEVGDQLNRTSAACGFRWNAEVRNKYHSAIELAKRQRKEKKRNEAKSHKIKRKQPLSVATSQTNQKNNSLVFEESALTLDHVILFLNQLKEDYYSSSETKMTVNSLQNENKLLQEEVEDLKKKLTMTKNKLETVEADYQMFIQIMERARKMTVLDDQNHLNSPTFKMDKNGNLEQFAQGTD